MQTPFVYYAPAHDARAVTNRHHPCRCRKVPQSAACCPQPSNRIGVPVIVIVMGAVGVGKTTIASRLAAELGWEFVDADDFHSPTSKAKIAAGIPLNDADRAPWLDALHNEIQRWQTENRNATLACSALKQSYRDQLTKNSAKETKPVQFVYLKASAEVIQHRLTERHGHFANETLLPSQLETIEEPTNAITINAANSPEEIVRQIRNQLNL